MNYYLYLISLLSLLVSACSMNADILSLIPVKIEERRKESPIIRSIPVPQVMATRAKSQMLDNLVLSPAGVSYLTEIYEAGLAIKAFSPSGMPLQNFGDKGTLDLTEKITDESARNIESVHLLYDQENNQLIFVAVFYTLDSSNLLKFLRISLSGELNAPIREARIPSDRNISKADFKINADSIYLTYRSALNPQGGTVDKVVFMKFLKEGKLDISWQNQGIKIGSHTSSMTPSFFSGANDSIVSFSNDVNGNKKFSCVYIDGENTKVIASSKSAYEFHALQSEEFIFTFSKDLGVQKWSLECDLLESFSLSFVTAEQILAVEQSPSDFFLHILNTSTRNLEISRISKSNLTPQKVSTSILLKAPTGLTSGNIYKVATNGSYAAYLATSEIRKEDGTNISESTLRVLSRGSDLLPSDELFLHLFQETIQFNILREAVTTNLYGNHLLAIGSYFETRSKTRAVLVSYDKEGALNKSVLENGYVTLGEYRFNYPFYAEDDAYYIWVSKNSPSDEGLLKIIYPGIPDPNFGVQGFLSLKSQGYLRMQIPRTIADSDGIYIPFQMQILQIDRATGAIIRSVSTINLLEFERIGNKIYIWKVESPLNPPVNLKVACYEWDASGLVLKKELEHAFAPDLRPFSSAISYESNSAFFYSLRIDESASKILDLTLTSLSLDSEGNTLSEPDREVDVDGEQIYNAGAQLVRSKSLLSLWVITAVDSDVITLRITGINVETKTPFQVKIPNTLLANLTMSEDNKIYFMGLRGFTNPKLYLNIIEP